MRRRWMALGLSLTMSVSLLGVGPVLAQEPDAIVNVIDDDYDPNETMILAGQTVRWDFVGNSSHTVTSDGGFESSGAMNTGSYEVTFDQPGIYTYFCSIHGRAQQSGQIEVVETSGGEPTDPADTADGQPQQVSGADPVETALAWSALIGDGVAATALVGTSAGFADSLASGGAQGALDAPLLLTGVDQLDSRVAAELQRLGVNRVIILGGPAAISPAVEEQLDDLVDTVERASGGTRLETAREVADLALPGADTVIIARAFGEGSQAFADALGAGAAAAANQFPIVLTPTDSLDDGLAQWLTDRGVQIAYVVGGDAAVSQDTAAAVAGLGIDVRRLAGASRFSTAAQVLSLARLQSPVTVIEGGGELAWASGFAAALSSPGGIVLTSGPTVPGDTLAALFTTGNIVCGPTIGDLACGIAKVAALADPTDPPLFSVMDTDQEVDATSTGAFGTTEVLAGGPEGVCFRTDITGLSGPITVAHVHEAPFGTSGPPVFPIELGLVERLDPAAPMIRLGCVGGVQRGLLSRLFTSPGDFYVNVHTAQNMGGEIRGQIFPYGTVLQALLSGATEVPGPGDPDAAGLAFVFDTGVADEMCYLVDATGLAPAATMGHIHRGGAGEAGAVVVPLALAQDNRTAHCDRGLDPALVAEILDQPQSFYVNLHNDPFPAGAIRGQLAPSSSGSYRAG
ncbi:MAG: CHRD domain-containing protein [Euzebya sp.]